MRPKLKLIGFVLGCSVIGVGLGLAIAQQIDDDVPPDEVPPAVAGDPPSQGVDESGTTPPPAPPGGMYGIVVSKKGRKSAAPRRAISPDEAQLNLHAQAAAARQKRMTTYLGTQLTVNDEIGNLPVQKRVIAAFAQIDPKVQERTQHFAWVDEMPDLNPVGWVGHITKLQPAPAGFLIEIRVKPTFAPEGGHVITREHCAERWLYQGGALQQVPNPHAHGRGGVASLLWD